MQKKQQFNNKPEGIITPIIDEDFHYADISIHPWSIRLVETDVLKKVIKVSINGTKEIGKLQNLINFYLDNENLEELIIQLKKQQLLNEK